MNDHGIDYGMGTTNLDTETGIRYGVIPLFSLSEWAGEEFEPDYGDPSCGNCGGLLEEYGEEEHGEYLPTAPGGCCDYACDTCERVFDSSDAYPEEPIGSYLDARGYRAELHSDGDVFLLLSPYFTHAQFCSPCAPGACHLSHPVGEDGPMAYCFGPDWFEGDQPPYAVYRVSDGTLIHPGPEGDEEGEEAEGEEGAE